jgi:hypothetical protein
VPAHRLAIWLPGMAARHPSLARCDLTGIDQLGDHNFSEKRFSLGPPATPLRAPFSQEAGRGFFTLSFIQPRYLALGDTASPWARARSSTERVKTPCRSPLQHDRLLHHPPSSRKPRQARPSSPKPRTSISRWAAKPIDSRNRSASEVHEDPRSSFRRSSVDPRIKLVFDNHREAVCYARIDGRRSRPLR